jgi:PAS domain S-box-containing protein
LPVSLPNTKKNYFSQLFNLLNGSEKTYYRSFYSFFLTLFIGTTIDVIYSLQLNMPFMLVVHLILFLCCIAYVFFSILSTKRQFPGAAVLYFCSVGFLTVQYLYGNETGEYLFYFPTILAFINVFYVYKQSFNKTGWFIFNVAIFIGGTIIINFLPHPYQKTSQELSQFFLYRVIYTIVLTAILSRHLIILYKHKKQLAGNHENYFEVLFQSALDGYFIFNSSTLEIIDYNKRIAELFNINGGTLKGTYMGRFLLRHLHEDSPNMQLILDKLPGNWHGEATFKTPDNAVFHAYLTTTAFVKEEESLIILSIRDISNLKEAEQALRYSKITAENAAKAKARFLSSMSHELRTPLNGIIGTSNLLLTEKSLPINVTEHIDVLKYSSEHMLGIINDILDFSKIDAGKMELQRETYTLATSIEKMVSPFKVQYQNKHLFLNIDIAPALDNVVVHADQLKLNQVLTNLLSNALKFTITGGVVLSVKLQQQKDNTGYISFEVTDSGIGIAQEKLSDIFSGFTQVHGETLKRRFGGTGLGLTISEKLVEMMGGKLQVRSKTDEGSTFYFTVPLELASIEPLQKIENSNAVAEEKDIRGVRVLIVEDNDINTRVLKSFLQKWKLQVKEAANGLQALELMKYHSFDIVLMDLEMPEMDGYTATGHIRGLYGNDIPVIAFTAALLEDMETKMLEAGFTDYMLKPFKPNELNSKIQQYAERKISYA